MEFGISLDPSSVPQRHDLYDSDEGDEPGDTHQITELTFNPPSLKDIHKNHALVIAIGQIACIFVKSHFVLSPLCSLEASTQTIFKGMYFPKHGDGLCLMSELLNCDGGDTVFCIHERWLKPEYVNTWSKQVLGNFNPACVLILTSLPAHTHFSPHSEEFSSESCFLRSLKTASWSQSLLELARPLEPPNTLSGEAAAVLTACQVRRIPAFTTALYTMSSESASEQVAGFAPLLEHPVLAPLTRRPSADAERIVKKMEPKPREDLAMLYT